MSSRLDVPADNQTILLVGEQDDFEEVLVAHGYGVRRAEGASECIRLFRQSVPAIIVMDRVLPDGDGWEVVRELRSLASRFGVKVIALTSDDSHRSVERALLAGCESFLGKPCNPIILLDEVRRLLAPKGGPR